MRVIKVRLNVCFIIDIPAVFLISKHIIVVFAKVLTFGISQGADDSQYKCFLQYRVQMLAILRSVLSKHTIVFHTGTFEF